MSHNMLTQKLIGYQSFATTCLDASKLKKGYAGLLSIGDTFRGIGVCKDGLYLEENGNRQLIKRGKFNKIYLRQNIDCHNNVFQFSYSEDGETFKEIGKPFSMKAGNWKGVRTGLYCYGKKGKAFFDFFHYDIIR